MQLEGDGGDGIAGTGKRDEIEKVEESRVEKKQVEKPETVETIVSSITILGVGHVFDIGERVRKQIFRNSPDAVAIELDRKRLIGLLQREHEREQKGSETGERGQDDVGKSDGEKDRKKRRKKFWKKDGKKARKVPLSYRMLARFQESMAGKYEVEVGEEMLHALKAGKDVGANVFLIDMDAERMMRRLFREMPRRERLKALKILIYAMLAGIFPRFFKTTTLEEELDRFSDDYDGYMKVLAEELPTVKRILIDERDGHMADALARLSVRYRRVMAVVGDGHVEGMTRILREDHDFAGLEIMRLKELREQKLPPGVLPHRVLPPGVPDGAPAVDVDGRQ